MEGVEDLVRRKIALKHSLEKWVNTKIDYVPRYGYCDLKMLKTDPGVIWYFQRVIMDIIRGLAELKGINKDMRKLVKNKRVEINLDQEDKICDYFESEELAKLRSPIEKEGGKWKKWERLYDDVWSVIQSIRDEIKTLQKLEEASLNVPNEELRTIIQNTPEEYEVRLKHRMFFDLRHKPLRTFLLKQRVIDEYAFQLVDQLPSQKIVLDAEAIQVYFLKEGPLDNIRRGVQTYTKLKKAGVNVPEIVYFYRQGIVGYIVTRFLKGFVDLQVVFVHASNTERAQIAFLLGETLAGIHRQGILVDAQYSNFLVRNYFGHITIVALDFEYPFRISFDDIINNRDRVAALVHDYREYFHKGYK